MLFQIYKAFLFSILILISVRDTFPQSKRVNQWYFGANSILDFSSDNPVYNDTISVMSTYEGSASIADTDGNLLFYTDGETVWNKNNLVMLNGNNLSGYRSAVQAAVIVPVSKECADRFYYIFTSDGWTFDPPTGRVDFPNNGVFSYSLVDMSGDGDLGEVIEKNVPLLDTVNENVAAVKHANGIDTWVVVKKYNSVEYHAFLITESGIQSSVVSSVGLISVKATTPTSQLKISPDGKRLAHGWGRNDMGLELFDFDDATGIITNPRYFGSALIDGFTEVLGAYGISFSPNSDVLYMTHKSIRILQFNLNAGGGSLDAIKGTMQIIGPPYLTAFDMQTGPDGKLYFYRSTPSMLKDTIGVINNPDVIGSGCNFDKSFLAVSKRPPSLFSESHCFPNFIQTYLRPGYNDNENYLSPDMVLDMRISIQKNESDSCSGRTYLFELEYPDSTHLRNAKITWDFDDPISSENNTGSTSTVSHKFSNYGNYNIKVLLNDACNTFELTEELHIDRCVEEPEFYIPNVFSPDHNGRNDKFGPVFSNQNNIAQYQLEIKNKLGEQVFISNISNPKWNGNSNGIKQPVGTYVYHLNVVTALGVIYKFSGNILLIY